MPFNYRYYLTIEFILTPIPSSVNECRQFSQGSPDGIGKITFTWSNRIIFNKKYRIAKSNFTNCRIYGFRNRERFKLEKKNRMYPAILANQIIFFKLKWQNVIFSNFKIVFKLLFLNTVFF